MLVYLPRLNLFKVEISEKLEKLVPGEHLEESLNRHRSGDFGIISLKDWKENEKDIRSKKGMVVSRFEYVTEAGALIEYIVCTDFKNKKTEVTEIEEDAEFIKDQLDRLK